MTYSPARSAVIVVWTSIAATRSSSVPSHVNSPVSRCSVSSSAPSAAKERTSAETSATGRRVWAFTPGACVISACGSAARSPSSGDTV